jgi:peptidoglycan-N-acetylglucosamine deacetylase
MAKPVFYDPRQSRWRVLRRLFDILGVTITLLVIFFVYNAIRSEQLPGLLLPAQKRPYHALKEKEKEKEKEKRKQAALRRRKTRKPPSQVTLNADEGIRAAFYVQWDAASFSSLREYARQIDLLYPEWLHVLGPDGNVQGLDQQTYRYFNVVQDGKVRSVDEEVMPFLKSEDTGMEVFPLVNNFDETEWKPEIATFLMNPAARASFRQQIDAFLASDKYHGLMVDFEDFAKSAQPGYMALLSELSADLHSKGMKLYVSVPARDRDFDYAAIAAQTDGLVLMNYDEHESENDAGPVASQDWFTKNLEIAKQKVPLNKLICAIGNYGYDWVQKPKKNPPPNLKNINVTVQEAWIGARDSDEDIGAQTGYQNVCVVAAGIRGSIIVEGLGLAQRALRARQA